MIRVTVTVWVLGFTTGAQPTELPPEQYAGIVMSGSPSSLRSCSKSGSPSIPPRMMFCSNESSRL